MFSYGNILLFPNIFEQIIFLNRSFSFGEKFVQNETAKAV